MLAAIAVGWLVGAGPAQAASELADAEKLLATGKYAESEAAAREAVRGGAGGRLAPAAAAGLDDHGPAGQGGRAGHRPGGAVPHGSGGAQAGPRRVPGRRRPRIARRRCWPGCGSRSAPRVLQSSPADDLVAAGEAALLAGDEPKSGPGHLLRGGGEAGPALQGRLPGGRAAGAGQTRRPRWPRIGSAGGSPRWAPDADLHAGLARAFYESDRKEMLAALDAALHLNPRHVAALLLRAEHEIDGEDYPGAVETLERVLSVDRSGSPRPGRSTRCWPICETTPPARRGPGSARWPPSRRTRRWTR